MTEIIVTGIVLFVIYLIRQNYLENKRQEERKRQQLLDEQKRQQEAERKRKLDFAVAEKKRKDEVEKKRLDELNNETITIVYESLNENGKPTGIAKRANNTYASVERESQRFQISEQIRIAKTTLNQWNWYSEATYQSVLATKRREETARQQQQEILRQQSQYLDSFRIEYLYHMTHKSNLQNILQNGLLSHNQARNGRLTQVDIADNQVNDRRSRNEPIYQRSIHDYVPLYFNPKNPMLYRRGNIQNDIIILAIDRSLLYQPNTVFTNGNAAAGATSFYSNPDDLTNLNWACINAEYWNDIVDGKRIKCSEVLVYPSIPTTAIKKILCNNQQTKQFVESGLINHTTIGVEIKSNLYFSGFVQQNNNYQNTQPPTNYTTYDPIDDLPF
ncbi:MAG: DarT ssDNA thymidine ADP-ribosyltransferase family protein [Paludibacteraceae bacterium]